MGIMCKKSFLSKFDWEKYQNNFFLYLQEPVDSISSVNSLLDPEFFDV